MCGCTKINDNDLKFTPKSQFAQVVPNLYFESQWGPSILLCSEERNKNV